MHNPCKLSHRRTRPDHDTVSEGASLVDTTGFFTGYAAIMPNTSTARAKTSCTPVEPYRYSTKSGESVYGPV
ncbi:hypothetical protein BC936DRAFT_139548 [Jimgerdemannia flammicorona]|uniref:Uncharacterized protein n=1 Tax=Jimgerdemannia flammicorona TaxID=994334 RepID=A0A433B9N5_9FUNG|nr:hypothetical protein BC936DRAFT_139548 [Jimgerdemannia flammicorona]